MHSLVVYKLRTPSILVYDEVNNNSFRSGGYLHQRFMSSNTAILNDVHDGSDDSAEYMHWLMEAE